ncbi:MAG: serpin family protein [bacterium]
MRVCLLLVLAVLPLAGSQPAAYERAALGAAQDRFGLKLLGELVAEKPGANVFISPLSVMTCLSMARVGAAGQTEAGMARALELGELSRDGANRSVGAQMRELAGADKSVTLSVANSAWARKGVKFQKAFLDANKTHYAAQVSVLDFKRGDAVGKINGWVKTQTRGLIPEIVSSVDPADVLFLINAVYFKGRWSEPFEKRMSHEEWFHFAGGDSARRMMMMRSDRMDYLGHKLFDAVRLPYGSGRMQMYVFVPRERDGIDALLAELTPANWGTWVNGFYKASGELTMPRFKFDYEANLNRSLGRLGMAEAFSPQAANFSAMVKPPVRVFISEVKHKTFVEVNEEGTEAAAVTSTRVAMTAMMPEPHERFTIKADHPFLVAIRDDGTGALLFLGVVHDPKQ